MPVNSFIVRLIFTIGLLCGALSFADAATITTAGSGNWNSTTNNAPWPGGTVPQLTDNVIIAAGNTVTVTADASITDLTLNAINSKLIINNGQTLTVSGAFSNSGTTTNGVNGPGTLLFTGTATFGSLTPTGTYPNVTVGDGSSTNTVTIGANTLVTDLTINANATLTNSTFTAGVSGNLSVNGTFTAGTGVYTLSGTTKTIGGTATSVSIPSLTVNGSYTFGGSVTTLTVGTALAGTGTWTQSANSTLELGGTSAITTLTATAAGNTVNFNGAGAQGACKVTTYNNLILSNSNVKTFATTPSVNAVFSLEGTATVVVTTGVVTYGASATLQYNTTTARSASAEEWITPFAATGGVIITNTGAITTNGAKVFNEGVPLTIQNGATFSMSNQAFTFNGDLINNGGSISGTTGAITISGTVAQSIGAFTTTGTISMTKTAGTATFTGNVSGAALTINGSGGTLSLGAGLTHTFTGAVNLTNGTLNGGSSTLNENLTGTAWTGTGSVFSPGTGTVIFGGVAQTLSATATTFNNVTFSNSGVKTLGAIETINGTLTVNTGVTLNAAAFSHVFGVGSAATIDGTFQTANTTGFSGAAGAAISSTNSPTINLGASSSVEYTVTTGTQTITGRTYNNLKLNNTSGTNTANGNIIVNGTLTTTAAGTLNMVTNTLSVSTVTNAGTIRTQNTSATPLTSGKTWGGTVNYNATTGGQTVVAGTYNILTMGNTSGTQTANGNLTVTTLNNNTNAADIFDLGTNTLVVTTITNLGTIRTQNTSATPFSAGRTWPGTVNYNATTGGQTVVAGAYTALIMGNTSGTQTLGGNISVSGALTVGNTILNLSSNNITNIGSMSLTGSTIQGTGTMTLGGNVTIVASANTATISAPVALGAVTRTFTVNDGASTDDLSITSVISGAVGLTKAGAGQLTLSGANTYTGVTTISAGTLSINTIQNVSGGSSALGAPTTVANGTVAIGATGILKYTGNGNTSNRVINGTADGGTIDASGLGTLTLTGGRTGNNNNLVLTGTGIGIESGAIGSGNATITKNGIGTWTISGANAYTGVTSIIAGTLILGNPTALGTSTATTVSSGAVLDLKGTTLSTARPLTLNGTGLAASPAGALTNTGPTATYLGAITLGATVPGATITATTSGTLTCSGAVGGNTFPLTLDGAGTGTMSGIIGTTTGTVTKNGTGTWTLSRLNTYTGATTINTGTLKLGISSAATASGPLGQGVGGTTVASGAVLDLNGFSLTGTYNEAITLNGTGLAALPAGALTNTGAIASSIVCPITLGPSGATITATSSATLTCSGAVGGNTYPLTLDGAGTGTMSGIIGTTSGTITKSGAGTWTLSGNSTYTGLTTIGAGTLKLGAAGTSPNGPLGTTGAGTVVSATGATLDLAGFNLATAEALTLNGTGISNGGAMINSSVTAVNYTGAITLASASSIGTTGNITLAAAGITGSQDLIKVGAGNLSLGSGTATIGGLTISAGTLTASSTTMNVAGDFNNNATFTHNSGTVNFNGSSEQVLGGTSTSTLNNLTLTNSAGLTISTSPIINNTLTFSSGKITTGGNNVTLGTTATTSGAGSGKYIYGNEKINIPNALTPTRTFDIGDASNYTPVTLAFTGTTSGSGSIMASTTAGEHPNIGTATIDDSKSVNRYWSLSNTGVAGFTSYGATFNFINPGDLDGGTTPTTFILGKYNGSSWSYPTVGSALSSSINVTGLTTFGSYAVGNPATYGIEVTPISGLVTTEAGGTDQFTIVLSSLPSADVTIGITSNDLTEGTVSASSVTFTTTDWATPQTITITGVDDAIADIDVPYLIVTAAAVSSDPNYNGMGSADVSVVNMNNDTPDPLVITCPANQNASFGAACNFTLPNYTSLASATGGTGTLTITQAPVVGTVITTNTLITLTVTDQLLVTDDCTFTVIVADNTPPNLDCSAIANPTNVNANGGCTETIPYLLGSIVVSDNCSATYNITKSQSPTAGTSVGPGTTVITITATDQAGNSSNCNIDFVVTDNTPPSVYYCPADQLKNPNSGSNYIVSGTEFNPSFGDNCSLTITNNFNGTNTLSGASFPAGNTTVGWTATDVGGDNVTCTYNVFVRPSVTLSVDNSSIIESGAITVATVTATLNVVSTETVTAYLGYTGTASNGSDYTPSGYSIVIAPGNLTGTVTITTINDIFEEVDETVIVDISSVTNGIEAGTQQLTITVISDDNPDPLVITCPANQTGNLDASCEFILPDYTTLAIVTGGTGSSTVTQDPVSGTIISSNTTITLTATDEVLVTDNCTFDVNVTDVTNPVATCTSNKTVNANHAGCTYLHSDNSWNASATDNCTVSTLTYNLTGVTSGSGTTLNGVSFNLGTTTVTWTANDGTNNGTCNFTVTVQGINVLVSNESSQPLCPQFNSPFNADNSSYNEGSSETIFRVTRQFSNQNWKFYYTIEEANSLPGFNVLSVTGAGEVTPTINPSVDGANWYFDVPAVNNYILVKVSVANIMGESVHVKFTLNTITSGGCSDPDTPNSTLILNAMPVVGAFN